MPETAGAEPAAAPGQPPAIEYFYCAHSGFAYLGAARLMQIAAAAARPLLHRPFDIRRHLPAIGAPPADRSAAWRAHFFGREIERWSEQRDAPVVASGWPTHHHRAYHLANRLLIACQAAGGDTDRLSLRVLQAHWRDDADLSDRNCLAGLLRETGQDPALLAAAGAPEAEAAYLANTAAAIERPVFGSPSYIVDGDMFYGQDRLEMVERALRRPYARRR